MNYLIGIDLGGTNIFSGLLDQEGKVLRTKKLPTEVKQGAADVISRIGAMVRSLLSEAKIQPSEVMAVGIGTPGFVDSEQGIVRFACNLGWNNVPLAERLSQEIRIPVYVNNDVQLYVFGEFMGTDYRSS